ncbi:nucleoside/nucleotide kinase family protein [Streptomyces sp. SID11385]|nr:nucleoside/nucleotide kinase family protein [Streptomyces sp. SID11385]
MLRMDPSFDALLARARRLSAPGRRRLLGIAGAPGAGKSTLAERIVAAVPGSVLVPMDGFHLAQAELERLGRAGRKGAPDTFDAAGYVALLRRLREPVPDEVVYAPLFRREWEEPLAGAVPVPPDAPLVVTEGNYLLLDTHPWAPVRDLLDDTWFLAPDPATRVRRLVERHVRYGRSRAEAERWVAESDEVNARLVEGSRGRAELVVRE